MAALIPVFGPYLGLIPAVIAALVGPTHIHNNAVAAVVVVIAFTIINEVVVQNPLSQTGRRGAGPA